MRLTGFFLTFRPNLHLYDVADSRGVCHEKKFVFAEFFKSIKPEISPRRLHPGAILKYLNSQTLKRTGNAANKDRKNLIAAWNWAVRYLPGWPRENPFTLTERQKGEEHPRYIPPVEDFWKVLDRTDGQDRVMLLAYLHTAARKHELFDLLWEDVDFERHRIRLWTRKRKGGKKLTGFQ
jgi:integrase